MTTRTRTLLTTGLALIALATAACSGGAGSSPDAVDTSSRPSVAQDTGSAGAIATMSRPAIFVDLPVVELVAPASTEAGRAPTFEWRPVDGAATYRLSVLAPDAPSWGWQGTDTAVRYGGVPDGVSGPSLRPGSWWSVAALSASGEVLAVSDRRGVSPTGEPGPPPAWATDANSQEGSTSGSAPVEPAATPAPTLDGPAGERACELLTGSEMAAAIQGSWLEPEPTRMGPGASWCDWRSENGTLFSLTVMPAAQYDPDGWGADATISSLGDRAYRVDHGWDRRIGFVHGDYSVTLIIDYTKVDPAGFESLAHLVDERLP